MSLISRIMQPRSNVAFREPFWAELFASKLARSGKAVNVKTALEVTTVFACLRVIAEGVSQVPLKLFRERPGGGSDPAKDHPLYRVLYRRPNQWQTSFEFRESLIFHAALAGDFFAFVNRVRGQIKELIPLDPGSVTVYRDAKGVLSYQIAAQTQNNSGTGYQEQPQGFGKSKTFPSETIWHVRGPSWNTWMGLPAVELAREAIGLSMATEEAHAKLHANGAQTSGLYSVDDKLGPDAYKAMREWIEKQITGANRHKPFILDRGAKYTPISMTGVDAQHIETRLHQISEICRPFRVMPIMIGHPDKTSTYASAEQMFLAHVVHCLEPWYERISQSIDVNLLSEEEQESGLYAKFISKALMRGAAKDRADYMYKRWIMGSMSPNDIRIFEDENPFEGGDRYYIATNIGPVDSEGIPEPGEQNGPSQGLSVKRIT
ncbi:MAG: phage portal protein [Desulfobacteraceae bacterium]|nr:phage portal protein [Desulfobacteraceae bacterium]